MRTGLWSLKDIQNLRQNRSKNKLVRENPVTQAQESCSLLVMVSCYCIFLKAMLSAKELLCMRGMFAQKCKVSTGFLYSVHMQ